MMRTGLGNRTMTPLMAKFFEREVISKVAARLSGDDVELRATLVGSQVGGMLMVRYVLRVKALADAPSTTSPAASAPPSRPTPSADHAPP